MTEDVQHVVHISTNEKKACELCGHMLLAEDSLAGPVNHYLQEHGYKLLHVGSETSHGQSGPRHSTVAVVGK